jgi:ubiquinone/menaquinone biosynthesis C-methylase UbiE
MMDQNDNVLDVYSQGGDMLSHILAFLKSIDIDPDNLSWDDLHVCDQMHSRGIEATREHAHHAGITSDMHVLEIGCGIGGASRYLAHEKGCRVTAIDLTQDCVDAASDLTARCGLAETTEFKQADATDLPFGEAQFDHVWSHAMTMNIQDKTKLASEIARVLKPGGQYSCCEVALSGPCNPHYPLPWASNVSSSFLVTSDDMIAALEAGGLKFVRRIDINDAYLAYLDDIRDRAKRGEKPSRIDPQSLKEGDDFLLRLQNCGQSAREGRLVEHILIAEKPS